MVLTRKRKRELEEQDNRPYWWPGRPRVVAWVDNQVNFAAEIDAMLGDETQIEMEQGYECL